MSDKIPTPKQSRNAYKRIVYAKRMLNKALRHAREIGLIKTENGNWEQCPLSSFFKMEDKIVATTEKELARAMRMEITDALRR